MIKGEKMNTVQEMNEKCYINADSPTAMNYLGMKMYEFIKRAVDMGYKSIVFLCIGTDRSTGDSLGPLVGYKIYGMTGGKIYVYGTLEKPVHARNLEQTLKEIRVKCPVPYIIAVDACLGSTEHVGCISIGEGPIKPGAGVNKDLEPVGDMHITGIVNFGGFMDFFILQNTRLGVVMKMADVVSSCIMYVVNRLEEENIA
jgi:putative sporulation protein YyaC